MTSAAALSVEALVCRYGDAVALDRVSLVLRCGEILGVTGAPGAGTSTLIKAIVMLVAPQSGRVLIMGKPHDLASSRSQVAYLPETIRPPGHLAGHDFVAMARTVQPGTGEEVDIVSLAADLAFDPALLAHPIRRYAKDEVQKLGLIAAFSAGRPILLLDRPMLDLEPAARAGLRHRLKTHAAKGGAILIGSPSIEDHQGVVDRLVMLKDGSLGDADLVDVFRASDAAA
jgi:ABC-2 type transport system ATP-binding protein